MRVLIVEDDPNVGAVLRELCLRLGYRAETVRSAEDALARLQGDRPDLILLDVRLPGMSGLDFLRIPVVQEAAVPIIVMSGDTTESQAQECLQLGAVQVLAKPVPFDRLQRLLEWFERPAPRPVERRRTPRVRVALPVRVHAQDGAEWETTSVDLSAEAMKVRVRSAAPARAGSTVTLSFEAPNGDQRVEAVSLMIRADVDGYVFYFLNLTEDHFERLTYLMRRLTGS